MTPSMWFRLDNVAHFLYTPTMWQRNCAVARWHHRIHLIPTPVVEWVCDRYDRSMDAL